MAKVEITSASTGGGSIATGVLQLLNGVAMSSSLVSVTDQNNTTSPLKLSTTLVQVVSTLRITTADNPYIDAEDSAGNNRFTIGRDPSSQQVNVDFASNPTGGSAIVGAIRTYVDDVNLSEIMQFREDGRIQIGSTSASAMYWDNTNNRLNIGQNTGSRTVNINDSLALYQSGTTQLQVAFHAESYGGRFAAYTAQQFVIPNSYAGVYAPTMNIGSMSSTTNLGATVGIKGSGSTSATTSFLVQNSTANTALTIKDNQSVFIGNYVSETGNNVIDQLAWKLYTQGGTQYASYIGATNNGGTGDTSLALFGLGTGGGYVGGIRMFTSSNSATPLLAMIVDRNQSVGIGLTNSTDLSVNSSAKLQVDSTTKGFLPPRMTNAQRSAIASPAEGLQIHNTTNNGVAYYDGTNWGYLSGAKQSITITGATQTIFGGNGNIVALTMQSSTTLTFSNHVVGTYIFQITQGGTGSYTITWPVSVLWSGGTAPTLTTTVGKTDIVTLFHDGTNFYGTYSLNY